MPNYTKLFNSIVTSTIWTEDDKTRIVWITMLAIADQHGEVQASIPGLARVAGVSVEAAETAINRFLSPDSYSRTPDDEGRRIEKIDGGWLLLNHAKYRAMASKEDSKAANANRQRRHRNKIDRNASVTLRNGCVTPRNGCVTQERDIAEAEAEANKEKRVCASKEKAAHTHVDSIPSPEPEKPAWKDDDPMHTLMRRINSLLPAWSKPSNWNAAEMHMLHGGTAKQLAELEIEDWNLLSEYLRKPTEKGFWQPHTRSKFVETFPDVWQAVQRWQQAQPKTITRDSESTFY